MSYYCLAFSEAMKESAWRALLADEAYRTMDERLFERSGHRIAELSDVRDLTSPVSAEDWNLRGYLLQRQLKRYDEAEVAYRKSVELDADSWWAWTNLGDLLAETERCDEAEAAYRRALPTDRPGWAWPRLVDFFLSNGRFDEVEAAYRELIATDSGDANAWFGLGNLLGHNLARAPEAEGAYLKAIELKPGEARYRGGPGRFLISVGRHEDAECAYRETVKPDPSALDEWQTLGYLLVYFAEPLKEGISAYNKALAIDPGGIVSRSDLLAAKLIQGELAGVGDNDFDGVAGRHPDHGADLLRAIRAIAQNNYGAAEDAFASALSADTPDLLRAYEGFVLL